MINLELRELAPERVEQIYREHIVRDFPPDEQKPLVNILRAMERGEYVCYGAFEEDRLLAYAFFASIPEGDRRLYLFDYLAVCRGLRDKGIGSAFLQALMRGPLRQAACVLLEIDDPDFAADEQERALRLRRRAFYMRNGLRDTGVTAVVYHVEFRILELPVCPPHSMQEAKDSYKRLYGAIMPEWIYRNKFRVNE